MKTYFSYNALESQRAAGYKNTQYALAELIDNALDASASKVKVIFFEKRDNNRRYVDEIIVCDNGVGMSNDTLESCLQFGATTNTDLDAMVAAQKKGKFGFGLPNASLSQCTNVSVYSWQNGGDVFSSRLNLKELRGTGSIDMPPLEQVQIPSHYENANGVLSEESGTIIAWKNCDRLSFMKGETLCIKCKPILGTIYRYLIAEGKSITLEVHEHNSGQNTYTRRHEFQIVPNDPLFLMENTLIAETLFKAAGAGREFSPSYQPFSLGQTQCRPTNVKLADKSYPFDFRWNGRDYKFEITTSHARVEIQKPGIRIGAHTPVGTFYGDRDSISFIRAGREIASGTFDFYRKTEPQNRWWSIEVKFNADADDLMGVFNTKQGIKYTYTDSDGLRDEFNEFTSTLPEAREELWIKLTQRIDSAYKEVWSIVRNQGRDWDLNHQEEEADTGEGGGGLPSETRTTTEATRTTDGTRPTQFKDEQKRSLIERLTEKFPTIPQGQIEQSVKRFDDSRVRGCILYHASEDQSLWSMTDVYGFLIILINTNHSFYTNILAPLRNTHTESALSAIELFISSLAWEEKSEHFMQPEKKTLLEEFRAYVGIHLNRYIRDNSITLENDDDTLAALHEDGGTSDGNQQTNT